MATNVSAVSARRIAANRRNAKKSTGPRTAAGKARSSKNASTHQIFCRDAVVEGESGELFQALRTALIAEHQPQTITELFLVDRMAAGMWRLGRVQSAEMLAHAAVAEELIELRAKQARRQARLAEERAEEREEEWEKEDNNNDPDPEENDASSSAPCSGVTTYALLTPREQHRAAFLERLNLYEKRIEGTVHRSLRDLRKLRTLIKGEQVPDQPSPFLSETAEPEPEPVGKSKPKSKPGEASSDLPAEASAGEAVATVTAKLQNEPNEAAGGHCTAHFQSTIAHPPSAMQTSVFPLGEAVRGVEARAADNVEVRRE